MNQNTNEAWSLLDLVNRVRNECGIESVPSDARDYDMRCVSVTNAINDSVLELWRLVRWPWTRYSWTMPWVAGTSEYNLPDRFFRVASSLEAAPGYGPMQEMPPDEFMMTGWNSQDPYPEGTPSVVTYFKNYLKVWPAPSTNFVASYPNASMEYFREPPPRVVEDNDGIELPAELIPACVAYGKWKLKLHVGDSDWQHHRDEYERLKSEQMIRYHVGRRANRMLPDDFTPSLWG
jgi:hypothetical protein